MKSIQKYILPVLALLIISSGNLAAQCAMCRVQVENNVSHGETAVAAGLNFGILYLFAMPYLAFLLIAFFWYRASKKNQAKKAWLHNRIHNK